VALRPGLMPAQRSFHEDLPVNPALNLAKYRRETGRQTVEIGTTHDRLGYFAAAV